MLKDHRSFLKALPTKPGIYQMFDRGSEILYVGKAKNLKKRLSSYFRGKKLDAKSQALMAQVDKIEITITADENEALLLENNLIKQLRPRYNIFFKDDKSFPYLLLSQHKFPRLFIYRGAKDIPGEYFGPFPSAGTVHETLHIAQKIFLLRSCNDTFFRYRMRPCLQYQIKRCSAPCVGYIDEENYQHNVQMLKKFLCGKNKIVMAELQGEMQSAAAFKRYELAAAYRDKLASLSKVMMPQRVIKDKGDLDVIALAQENRVVCLQVLLVRSGAVVGSKAYFPLVPDFAWQKEILSAFLQRNYLDFIAREELPKKILTNMPLADRAWLQAVFQHKYSQKMQIVDKTKNAIYKDWIELAETNAFDAISRHLLLEVDLNARFKALQNDLEMAQLPKRIVCFDISHKTGEATVGVCVVFTAQGALKSAYRRFNIEGIEAGDDYAAMWQALLRYFTNLKEKGGIFPDVLLIDGGKGQLRIGQEIFRQLKIVEITLLAIAKDKTRANGNDLIYWARDDEITRVDCSMSALHLLQQIRDETHRFAVTSHRRRYAKSRRVSVLQSIAGIGAKRRAALLKRFGGLQELKDASIEDLHKVPGVNLDLALRIYKFFHKR